MIEIAFQVATAIALLGLAVAAVRASWRLAGRIENRDGETRAVLDAQVEMARSVAQAEAACAAAAAALQPRSISYAPHIITRAVATADQAQVSERADQARVPSFAELLQQGTVGKGNPLLLGYANGAPRYGSWLDLYSTGIGGVSGSGKSWTAAYLLSQSILHGARVAILDPHADDRESLSTRLESLSGRFLCEVASAPRQMLETVRLVEAEIHRRKTTPQRGGDAWIIVADEMSALMRGELSSPLARLFETIAQEGRKLAVFAMILGQVWQTSRSGGGELRDSLASAYLHRLRPNQARYLSGLPASELPRDLLDLPAGTAYLMATSGNLDRVTIPRCTEEDIRVIGQMKRVGSGREMDGKPGDTPLPSSSPPSLHEQRILALARAATPISQIVQEVWGVRGGGKYQERAAEVMRVIAGHL